MLIVRLTLLFVALVVVPAVTEVQATSLVPATADEKTTSGDVTFECRITGSDKDGFTLFATSRGKTDKKCRASCTLTRHGGGTGEYKDVQTVTADRDQTFLTKGGLPSKPLSYLAKVFRRFEIVISSIDLIEDALDLHRRYKLNWYDCLIVAASLEAKCDVLYTEDLQHGQRFGDLVVMNPFRQSHDL